MRNTRVLIGVVTGLLCLSVGVSSAWADSARRYRCEGFAIGVCTAALLHAVCSYNKAPRQPAAVRCAPPVHGRIHEWASRGYGHRRAGHWRTARVWVAPVCKRVRKPGHTSPGGKWVPGRWTTVVKRPRHWEQRSVRVVRR
ncbi:hypothetical protein ACFL0Q_07435 [Thermodesulfobacteriota bacterium]